MGWIAQTFYNVSRGFEPDVMEVREPAGFEGESITPAEVWNTMTDEPVRYKRNGRVVHATAKKAMSDARQRCKRQNVRHDKAVREMFLGVKP